MLEYGLSCFLGLHVQAFVFNPCLGLLLRSFCIYMYRSTFKYTYDDGRGTKEFCRHNIGLKGYWGLLKETGMFSFFTQLLVIILWRKSFPFLKTTSKYNYCVCFWLVVSWKKLLQPIRSTKQIWVVICHQYWISVLLPPTSFHGETSGGMVKSWLFSRVIVL